MGKQWHRVMVMLASASLVISALALNWDWMLGFGAGVATMASLAELGLYGQRYLPPTAVVNVTGSMVTHADISKAVRDALDRGNR